MVGYVSVCLVMTQITLQHQSGMYPMASDLDLLTIAEAAGLLKISTVTIQRWIKQGRLTAYHVGPRKVRIHRSDLIKVLTLTQRQKVRLVQDRIAILPLSDEQVRQGFEALKKSEALIQRIREQRQDRPLPPSWQLIRQEREKRSKNI